MNSNFSSERKAHARCADEKPPGSKLKRLGTVAVARLVRLFDLWCGGTAVICIIGIPVFLIYMLVTEGVEPIGRESGKSEAEIREVVERILVSKYGQPIGLSPRLPLQESSGVSEAELPASTNE